MALTKVEAFKVSCDDCGAVSENDGYELIYFSEIEAERDPNIERCSDGKWRCYDCGELWETTQPEGGRA